MGGACSGEEEEPLRSPEAAVRVRYSLPPCVQAETGPASPRLPFLAAFPLCSSFCTNNKPVKTVSILFLKRKLSCQLPSPQLPALQAENPLPSLLFPLPPASRLTSLRRLGPRPHSATPRAPSAFSLAVGLSNPAPPPLLSFPRYGRSVSALQLEPCDTVNCLLL